VGHLLVWVRSRLAPVAAAAAALAGGMLYVIVWGAVRHHGTWLAPPDLWNSVVSAVAVSHLDFSGVYYGQATLLSPPGLEYLLAPVTGFWPIAALCLLLCLRRSWRRFWVCAAAALTNLVLGNYIVHSIGLWWPAVMATAAAMLLLAAVPPAPGAPTASSAPGAPTPAVEFEAVAVDSPTSAGPRR
jgi:hypothetical protein